MGSCSPLRRIPARIMKPLRDYQVAKGGVDGPGRITLNSSDGKVQLRLRPDQAERLGVDILAARYDLPPLLIIAPRAKRRAPGYIVFRSQPRALGSRPSLSEQTINAAIKDPDERARVRKELAQIH